MNLQRQALQRRLGGATVEAFGVFLYKSFWVVPIVPPKKPAVGPHQLPSVWATWDDAPLIATSVQAALDLFGDFDIEATGGGFQNLQIRLHGEDSWDAQPSEWNLIPLLFDLVIMLLIQPANGPDSQKVFFSKGAFDLVEFERI